MGVKIIPLELNLIMILTNASQAFGGNLKLVGSKYCIYSGDVDQDGFVDNVDISDIYNDAINFVEGYVNTDLNRDNFVDNIDLSLVYNNSLNFVGAVKP